MTKHMRKVVGLLSVVVMMAFFAPQQAAADDDDPPSRVARLGYLHGPVSFEPAGTDDWVDAVVNRPMTTGDKLWLDGGARGELHIGSASIRLSGNTGFSFLNLTDQMTQLRLTQGTLRVRVKRLDENETFEVDTPNLAFSVLRPGVYRISVNEGGDTTVVKIRGGEGEVTGGGSAYTVHAGESGTFTGTDQLIADMDRYGDDDDFDSWCADRDRREDRSASARYVSTDVIGYEDLDEYGGWRPVPDYGMVWFPHTTIVGWTPYHYGHWAYVHPWGYTWIDDAPWGFAPFHYGRWVNVGGWWGWVPCPPPAPRVVYVRPVYAPALVAWVGGPHFGVGVSFGWFPLGPREVYVPSYPVSRTYVNNVNVSNTTVNTTVINNYYNNNTTVINRNTTVVNNNVTVINQKYVNQSVPGAVTATTSAAFTSAQPVAKNVVQVNQREIATAQVGGAPAVAPAKQAVLGAGATASVRPPAALQNRAVVAKTTPPPPPVPFARQQQAIQANGGRPLAVSQVRQMSPANAQVHPNVRVAPPSTPVAPQNARGNNPVQLPANAGNKPATVNNAAPAGQGNKPANAAVNNDNRGATPRSYNDRPPSARPASAAPSNNNGAAVTGGVAINNGPVNNRINNGPADNRGPANNGGTINNHAAANNNGAASTNNVRPQLDEKHQQQLEDLRAKQDQERQKVEQQQQERQRLAQKNADEQRQAQSNQKHQAQLQQLENKHDTEQQKLQQKQQQERGKPAPKDSAPREKDDRQQHSK